MLEMLHLFLYALISYDYEDSVYAYIPYHKCYTNIFLVHSLLYTSITFYLSKYFCKYFVSIYCKYFVSILGYILTLYKKRGEKHKKDFEK